MWDKLQVENFHAHIRGPSCSPAVKHKPPGCDYHLFYPTLLLLLLPCSSCCSLIPGNSPMTPHKLVYLVWFLPHAPYCPSPVDIRPNLCKFCMLRPTPCWIQFRPCWIQLTDLITQGSLCCRPMYLQL